MKVLFLYYSVTKNTKKLMEEMFDEITKLDHDTTLKSIKEINQDELDQFDLLVIGAPCHHAGLPRKLKEYLEEVPKEASFKYVEVFTHATEMPTDDYTTEMFNRWAGKCDGDFRMIESDNREYIGLFHCMSKASFSIEKFIQFKIIKNKEYFKGYKKRLRQSPTQNDFENGRRFIKDIISNQF